MSVLDHPVALEPTKARALLKAMADPLRLQVLEALGEVSAAFVSSPVSWAWPNRSSLSISRCCERLV